MTKNRKAVLIVLAVLAAIAAYGVFVMTQRASMTASATGTVLKSEFVRDTESSSLDETRIAYSFEAAGKRIEGRDSLSGSDKTADYSAGRTIQLCYNPKEPEYSRINQGGPCG